jgi:long-chain acyl-CoA synthetase
MGGSSSKPPPVSVIAEGEEFGPFATRRCPGFGHQTLQNPPEYPTMQPWVYDSFKAHASLPYLGYRKRLDDNRYALEYTWSTYAECEQITLNLGSGLWEAFGLGPQSFIGIFSENRREWIHLINASALFGQTIVALYDTFGDDVLSNLIGHSEIRVLFASTSKVAKVLKIAQIDKHAISHVVLMSDNDPPLPASIEADFAEIGIEYLTFEHVLEIGREHRKDLPVVNPEWYHFICYSSGTTGVPKGVIISHRSMVNNSLDCVVSLNIGPRTAYLSYLPLPHVFERSAISVVTFVGGRVGMYSGAIHRMMEDMKILRPTVLCAVPRVLCRIYDTVMETVNKSSTITKGIFWGMWYWKRWWVRRGSDSSLANLLVFNKILQQVGGRINQWIIGGAAMDPWIHEFIQYATGIPVRAGYGLSESGSGNIVNPFDLNWSKPGTCGGPMPNFEVRLEPIEDYDDPQCGELICGGQSLCSGYLHDQEQTTKLFTDDTHKFIRTGDIGKWDSDNYLMIVDRMRSIFKLSQGEYVAAELLTNIYELAVLVQQIFVYGDSGRSYLVAVVVPARAMVARWAGKDALNDQEFADVCTDQKLIAEIKKQLDDLAVERKLPGYERIKAIALDWQLWTADNDLMTPTFKLRRKKLTEKYRERIEELYRTAA